MNVKIFLLIAILAILLCGCSNSSATEIPFPESTNGGVNFGEQSNTDIEDNIFTLPEELQGGILPEDDFDDEDQVVSSTPIATEPKPTEPKPTEPKPTEPPATQPATSGRPPEVLPEDDF